MRGEEIAFITGNGIVHYLNVDKYPSGEPMVKEDSFLVNRSNQIVRVILRPKSAIGFLGGIFWVQSLIERGHRAPELIVPCVFGARQDRINVSGDVLFTIKSVAGIINSLGCPKVFTLDPHSEATAAAIDRCIAFSADDIFKFFRNNLVEEAGRQGYDGTFELGFYDAVVAPDGGAGKRAGAVAKSLGVPVLQAWKHRDVKDGRITGFGVEDTSNLFLGKPAEYVPRVLVVDDLCDGGGTFVGLGGVLDAEGLDSDLYVTHGLFTRGTSILQPWFQRIFCTDSVAAQRPDVQIIKAADAILQYGDLI
jgi:ribose-phosphate pyrophosphokinase